MYDGWHTSLVSSHMYLDSEIYFPANWLELFSCSPGAAAGEIGSNLQVSLAFDSAQKKQIATRSCIYTIFFIVCSNVSLSHLCINKRSGSIRKGAFQVLSIWLSSGIINSNELIRFFAESPCTKLEWWIRFHAPSKWRVVCCHWNWNSPPLHTFDDSIIKDIKMTNFSL